MAELAGGCRWCGLQHDKLCPYVRAYEFNSTGDITRVEFLTPADYGTRRVTDGDSTVEEPAYSTMRDAYNLTPPRGDDEKD